MLCKACSLLRGDGGGVDLEREGGWVGETEGGKGGGNANCM